MPMGQKTCPKCHKNVGPRTLICKCGHDFHILSAKTKKKLQPKIVRQQQAEEKRNRNCKEDSANWHNLVKGDIIKIVGGGAYWPITKDKTEIRHRGEMLVGLIKKLEKEQNLSKEEVVSSLNYDFLNGFIDDSLIGEIDDCVGSKELITQQDILNQRKRVKYLKTRITRQQNIQNGESTKICIAYRGKFCVRYVDSEGIHAYPMGKNGESGHCFIYMGLTTKTFYGLVKQPHVFYKIKNSS